MTLESSLPMPSRINSFTGISRILRDSILDRISSAPGVQDSGAVGEIGTQTLREEFTSSYSLLEDASGDSMTFTVMDMIIYL
jgi:hypothetical protein